ncbi:MAG: mechanosensitive ion channel family protein [Nitrospira sp.]|nr:MAG: mechanosensitive ion channel family protein [Nitrospira sp.]
MNAFRSHRYTILSRAHGGALMAEHRRYFFPLLALLIALLPSLAQAQAPVPVITQASPTEPAGAPVMFEDEPLFLIYDKIGPFTPQERARAVRDRLARLAKDPYAERDTVTATDQELTSELVSGETVVMTVTERDAQLTGKSRQELAKDYAQKIQAALTRSREQVTLRSLIIDAGLALLDTAILIVLLVLSNKAFPKIYTRIDAWRGTVIRPIKIQRVELLSADQIAAGLAGLARAVRVFAVLFLLYVYLTSVLGIFPWTRGISTTLLDAVVSTIKTIGLAFSTYVPNIVSIAVIILVTRYILKLISLLFTGIGRGAITFAGFHRDWAEPTYKIVRFLVIVFAAIACFHYIPGSQSEGFRGISVFLGLLISLGSAAAIGNIIAGVVLTYMRPFHVGDRVKIADTTGDVMEKTLLVTRIRTIKNVDITIPNAMVLGSHLINYSSCAQDQGLILHTSVTIGYDAPWRTVHELLVSAARATTHISVKPEPFVLQTGLNDFYVTYELNAYTDQPNLMATIYAELHQHIQDKFNEAGVEIMSPHYAQIRDGNQTTIPEQYLPKTYLAPAFRIRPLDNLSGGPTDVGTDEGEPKP